MTVREIIAARSAPLAPQPTGVEPRLPTFDGIKAVLFDIYGTLFVSGSGDVGTAAAASKGAAAVEAFAAVGLAPPADGDRVASTLIDEIKKRQTEIREAGTPYPEIEIVGIWGRVFGTLGLDTPDRETLGRLATEYECRVNPVWPMPGCTETLRALHARRLPLGIVSNAQFFTEELFAALLGKERGGLGFEPDLEVFSYRTEEAKPGEELYRRAAEALAVRGIAPDETLYVGNDMLNDVTPAAAVGFNTVLFAGDARSLRMREGDERVAGVTADAVVTELGQIVSLLN